MTIITSKSNSLVKNTKKLHRKKYRKNSYLIEGWHLYEEALAAGATFRYIFTLADYENRITDKDKLVLVSPEVLSDLSDAPSPQGIVAEIAFPSLVEVPEFRGKWLFLESIQDPGNLGTMIRTADAAGFAGVLVSDDAADIYHMKTLRSMQGSHFHLPVYRMSRERVFELTENQGLPIWATTLSEDSVDYRTLDKPENVLLVMGNEGQGISQQVADKADFRVHIPMPGQSESLNVAVAAGIVMFSMI